MGRILQEYRGTEAQIRDGMETGMRRLFEKPYLPEISALMGWTGLSLEDGQRIFFFPRLSDMEVYVKAFQLDTPEATKRKEQLMKFKLLSVFYTLHRRDGGLAERFMHFGGLQSLVSLLGEENPVIQSQAMELLTDFLEPFMAMPPAVGRQAHLQHHVFLSLSAGSLWRHCSQILSQPGEVFPRSFGSSMRLLAAAIGWLRPPAGQVPEAAPSEMALALEALQRCTQNGAALGPELRGLAEELMEELANVPSVRSDPLTGEALKKCEKSIFEPTTQRREDEAHAWQSLKLLGSEAVKAQLWWPAEATYNMALEEGGKTLPDAEASLIHSNRALVLLKLDPAKAAEAAEAALRLEPRNAKAQFRRAQALYDLGSPEALIAVRQAQKLEPQDSKVLELLKKVEALSLGTDSMDSMD